MHKSVDTVYRATSCVLYVHVIDFIALITVLCVLLLDSRLTGCVVFLWHHVNAHIFDDTHVSSPLYHPPRPRPNTLVNIPPPLPPF